jgi:hypothetical protein
VSKSEICILELNLIGFVAIYVLDFFVMYVWMLDLLVMDVGALLLLVFNL